MTATLVFDAALRTADEWVGDITQRLGWRDRQRACGALLATLHALRDELPERQAIYLGAQLPIVLRGFYYDGWHPGTHPAGRGRGAFLERIHDAVHREPGIDAEQVARAVLALLTARLPATEVEAAKAATPAALHNLWPA